MLSSILFHLIPPNTPNTFRRSLPLANKIWLKIHIIFSVQKKGNANYQNEKVYINKISKHIIGFRPFNGLHYSFSLVFVALNLCVCVCSLVNSPVHLIHLSFSFCSWIRFFLMNKIMKHKWEINLKIHLLKSSKWIERRGKNNKKICK